DRQAALEKARIEATRELQRTRRELQGSGALDRARNGRTLRAQIDQREREVTHLDRELERLEQQRRHNRARARELVRLEPRQERGFGRQPALEPRPEREQDPGIEL